MGVLQSYWVNGRDSETGQPAESFFSDATGEQKARDQATSQGIVVESVERLEEAMDGDPTEKPVSPSAQPRPSSNRAGWYSWICLTVGQIVSITGCIGTAYCTLSGLHEVGSHHQFFGVVESPFIPIGLWFWLLLGGLSAICYNAAMYIVFSQAKHRGSRSRSGIENR